MDEKQKQTLIKSFILHFAPNGFIENDEELVVEEMEKWLQDNLPTNENKKNVPIKNFLDGFLDALHLKVTKSSNYEGMVHVDDAFNEVKEGFEPLGEMIAEISSCCNAPIINGRCFDCKDNVK